MKKRILSLLVASTMLLGIVAINVTAGTAAAAGERFTIEVTDYGWTRVINEGGATLGFSTDGDIELLIIDG